MLKVAKGGLFTKDYNRVLPSNGHRPKGAGANRLHVVRDECPSTAVRHFGALVRFRVSGAVWQPSATVSHLTPPEPTSSSS